MEEQVVNEIFKSLGIDGTVVMAQTISFFVLLVLLIKFLYKPMQSILQQRQEQIANSLTSAEAQQMQAEALRKEYEAHLANIADEARAKLDQAMKDAEAARQQLLEKTQAISGICIRASRRSWRWNVNNSAVNCATRCPTSPCWRRPGRCARS